MTGSRVRAAASSAVGPERGSDRGGGGFADGRDGDGGGERARGRGRRRMGVEHGAGSDE